MPQPLELRSRVWYNPEMSSINFNIPGLIGDIQQTVTLMLTSFSIVREPERGTMEQLIVTPITGTDDRDGTDDRQGHPLRRHRLCRHRPGLALNVFWDRGPIVGSIQLLLVFSLILLFGALGMGLLISIISKSQLQAMHLSMSMIMPNLPLSGYMFPRAAMPDLINRLSTVLPLTYFINVLRGIILKGNGLAERYRSSSSLPPSV